MIMARNNGQILVKRKSADGTSELQSVQIPVDDIVVPFEKASVRFAEKPESRIEITREERKIELVTPLFGGGVKPAQADPLTAVRATEIRGQLRFWWRAVKGGEYSDLAALKSREDEIFGSTRRSSALQISLETESSGQAFPPLRNHNNEFVDIEDLSSPLSYVAFPLRKTGAKVIDGITFKLLLSYPSALQDDVHAAFAAWEVLGGLGARTRRGFGSVQGFENRPADRGDLEKRLSRIREALGQTWPVDVPHLSRDTNDYKVTQEFGSVGDCWRHFVDRYKKFRQFRRPNLTSRSKWSEPDAIRRLFPRRRHPTHHVPITTVDKFPRAQFGLPIIFQFRGRAEGDPETTSLEGALKEQERFASPLCFRVVKTASGSFIGLAYVLGGTHLPTGGVILKKAPGDPRVRTDLTQAEASSPGLNDILQGQTDVVRHFLSTL